MNDESRSIISDHLSMLINHCELCLESGQRCKSECWAKTIESLTTITYDNGNPVLAVLAKEQPERIRVGDENGIHVLPVPEGWRKMEV